MTHDPNNPNCFKTQHSHAVGYGGAKVCTCPDKITILSPDQPALSTNEIQIGGNHYQTPIQPWDFITANGIGFLAGNAIKYIARHKQKGGIEDLKKARHYIDKLIEVESK